MAIDKKIIIKSDNYVKRVKIVLIAVFAILLCAIQLITMVNGNGLEKYIITEDVIVKHNGKKVFRGNIDNCNLKNIKTEDRIDMYMKLPNVDIDEPAIIYDNINTAVKIYIDDKMIYEIGKDTKEGGVVCHAYNKVALGEFDENSELRMSIRVMNGPTLARLPRIKMMNTYDLDEDYFYSMLIYIVMGVYLAVLGVVGLFIAIFTWKNTLLNKKIIALSIWNIVCALYVVSTFQVIPLFSDNYIMDAYIEYATKLLLIVMFNLYLCFDESKLTRKRALFLTIISGLYVVSIVSLQAIGKAYVNDTLNIFFGFCIVTGVNFIFCYLKNIKASLKNTVTRRYVLCSGTIAFSLVVAYWVVHAIVPNYSDYFLVVLPLVLLIILTMFFINLISEITKDMLDEAQQNALVRLAYMDRLTGIYNRRGMEDYIENCKRHNDKYLLYLFDLNGLKRINDTYGHATGDAYIVEFAKILSNIFKDGLCVRTGGDEYVVIDKSKNDSKDLMAILKEKVCQSNVSDNKNIKLSYSVGICQFQPNVDNIEEVLKIADKNMYKMKEETKKNIKN